MMLVLEHGESIKNWDACLQKLSHTGGFVSSKEGMPPFNDIVPISTRRPSGSSRNIVITHIESLKCQNCQTLVTMVTASCRCQEKW